MIYLKIYQKKFNIFNEIELIKCIFKVKLLDNNKISIYFLNNFKNLLIHFLNLLILFFF
jgi:hypothetical protein